jgi:hypothetical protein
MQYLHGEGIVHGDLRGVSLPVQFQNILWLTGSIEQYSHQREQSSMSCRFRIVYAQGVDNHRN